MPAIPKAGSVRSKYAFITAHRKEFPTEVMCRVLGVAPSGYDEWLQRPQSNRAIEDARLLRLIRASFTASQGVYGAPRVFLDLREAGETCSKHRVERLMRENGLRALHGYRTRRWVIGKPAVLIPNLLKRQFTVTRPNAAWATEITYIRTWQGWLYLSVVLDLFSRTVVGWATAPTIHRDLVLDAVAALLPSQPPRAQYESERELLGQRRGGKLLQYAQNRVDWQHDLREPRGGNSRHWQLPGLLPASTRRQTWRSHHGGSHLQCTAPG
jgi:putative transposase